MADSCLTEKKHNKKEKWEIIPSVRVVLKSLTNQEIVEINQKVIYVDY